MSGFGEAIKHWRKSRGLSQLELSLSANISNKHISFLETGRAQPSREMIVLLCNSLDVPLADRNLLFQLAGYTAGYSCMSIEQEEMSTVRDALQVMLDNHAPYPAMVFNWQWDIVTTNAPFRELLQIFVDRQAYFPKTNNVIELIFDPNAVRPFIDNWSEFASLLMVRVQREQLIRGERVSNLLEKMKQYPGIPEQWNKYGVTQKLQPMDHVSLKFDDVNLKLFCTFASFGTAVDVTMQELIIEQYFPLDVFTKQFFDSLTSGSLAYTADVENVSLKVAT